MKKEMALLVRLVGAEICHGTAVPETVLSEEEGETLYRLANLHDLSHIVASAMDRFGVRCTGTVAEEFQKQQMLAVYRYQQKRYELSRLTTLLEEAQIPFLPLKGSVLSEYYPSPWMRTSCDIDILVHREDLSRAIEAMTEKLSYRKGEEASHDVSLYSPNGGVHLELHFDLVEDSRAMRAPEILSEVWSSATCKEGYSYWYEMPDAMFYFYHIAHMAKHLERGGGCGLRSFLDLWILNHCVAGNTTEREALLQRGALLPFAKKATALAECWLGGGPISLEDAELLEFIVRGAAYGSTGNRVVMGQQKSGGRVSYLLSRVFLKYDLLKYRYPVLQRHRWLFPLMQVRRWCSLAFGGRWKRSVSELRANRGVTAEEIAHGGHVLAAFGLQHEKS